MFYNAVNGTIDLGNTEMDYITFGYGKRTVILIPGLGDGLRTVKGIAVPFAFMYREFAKDYKVYVFSRKKKLEEGYTTRDMARDQKIAIDKLGIKKADIVGVSSLRRGVAEAIEAVAHGDESTSRVVGRVIDEIKLPPGTIIGAVVRGNDVMIANDNLRIEQGDHVIMFLTDKKFITDVERLFQPSPFFL